MGSSFSSASLRTFTRHLRSTAGAGRAGAGRGGGAGGGGAAAAAAGAAGGAGADQLASHRRLFSSAAALSYNSTCPDDPPDDPPDLLPGWTDTRSLALQWLMLPPQNISDVTSEEQLMVPALNHSEESPESHVNYSSQSSRGCDWLRQRRRSRDVLEDMFRPDGEDSCDDSWEEGAESTAAGVISCYLQ